MHTPGLVGWLLAALCGLTGGYCLVRARVGPPLARQAACVEAVMGIGMAAMAVPGAPERPPAAFAVLFGATALWAAALLVAGVAHQAHHVVEGLAMVYMAVAMATAGSASGHAGHGPGGVPLLTGALLAYFALYALASAPRLLPAVGGRAHGAGGHAAAGRGGAFPEVAAGCRMTLAVAMFAMLLTV
ncbi:DUF5134 domain-containing protein [Streptomyces radicis]|uniref:DUF5134 domain-containing protein n=1 Tax=Streptomyces radicis TaxID=1750517 RepID=A0A3A9VV72_9ACTN|nr:DUF5134 domain-containing protein [Streptomyces radicis]RKN04422.1 DUF5134 domain-containing protein [Streptomyces radicis]RKN15190.1 DUF5134 domain-containing protein [Streptomyces radicis]